MPPPIIRVSHLFSRFVMTPILSATFAPPSMATKGRTGFSRAPPITESSLPIRKPATAGRYWATPAVEAWARCTVPKASDTYISAREASFLAKSGSFFSSSLWKRRFSRSSISPSLSSPAIFSVSLPMQSGAKLILTPGSSSLSLSATGARENSILRSPLGLPRWEQSMTFAPCSSKYFTVGSAAVMRLSSATFPS